MPPSDRSTTKVAFQHELWAVTVTRYRAKPLLTLSPTAHLQAAPGASPIFLQGPPMGLGSGLEGQARPEDPVKLARTRAGGPELAS